MKRNSYKIYREIVVNLMGGKCKNCGYDKKVNKLGVHHIDGNQNNNTKKNLNLLCDSCHMNTHIKNIKDSDPNYQEKIIFTCSRCGKPIKATNGSDFNLKLRAHKNKCNKKKEKNKK